MRLCGCTCAEDLQDRWAVCSQASSQTKAEQAAAAALAHHHLHQRNPRPSSLHLPSNRPQACQLHHLACLCSLLLLVPRAVHLCPCRRQTRAWDCRRSIRQPTKADLLLTGPRSTLRERQRWVFGELLQAGGRVLFQDFRKCHTSSKEPAWTRQHIQTERKGEGSRESRVRGKEAGQVLWIVCKHGSACQDSIWIFFLVATVRPQTNSAQLFKQPSSQLCT